MQIGKDQLRIVLEPVEDAIAVMRIDVDIGDARHAAARGAGARSTTPQSLNTQNPAARSRAAWCRPPMGTNARRRAPAHDPLGGGQARADHAGGRLEHAAKSGRIAAVQQAGTGTASAP